MFGLHLTNSILALATLAALACAPQVTVAASELPADAGTPAASPEAIAAGEPRLGRHISDFTLQDSRGARRRLSEWSDRRLLVVAFLGVECPLAKLYAGRLGQLAQRYGPRGVGFVGIDSNRQDSCTEVTHFAREYRLGFPLYKDPGNVVADQFGAIRTPEVFVLDADRVVRYWGRVDDQFGIGYQRSQPGRHDLAQALEELLAGRDVTQAQTDSPGCYIGRTRPAGQGEVTWAGAISRLFQKHCQECHRPGQIAPFPLLEYDEVVGWAEMIGEVVAQRRMPPWHADPQIGEFANDARLSDDEISAILKWVADGAPPGDPAELPPPRRFVEGFQIPEPDQIVYIADEPFTIPAEGVVDYQWFEVDPGFKEDKWIKSVECRPGNPAVVHHVTVYFKPPGYDWTLKLRDRINMVGGFAPGKRPVNVEGIWDGTARLVPAGSKFVFEMHYTPNGTVQTDRSCIALVFARPDEVRRQLSMVLVANEELVIPPHAENHPVESWYTLDEDSLIYSLSPHMHLRGKSFFCEILYPGGGRETLLSVPRFDFNWQNDYMFPAPKRLPRGARVHCVAHFDNSANNPANPDPAATVRWGDQIWEEMMIGAIAIAPADQDLLAGTGKPAMVHGTRRGRFVFRGLVGASLAVVVGGWAWRRRRRQAQNREIGEA